MRIYLLLDVDGEDVHPTIRVEPSHRAQMESIQTDRLGGDNLAEASKTAEVLNKVIGFAEGIKS